MEEILNRFVAWIKIKAKLHILDRSVYFRGGEIWWVNLGANVGHEEEGKNEHLLWAVPLTTNTKEANPYYHQYELNGKKYAAILSQLRILSSKRLIRKIGIFPLGDYEKIREKIRRLI